MTGPAPHRLDLTGVRDKAGLLRSCAEQLGFPDDFGHNWDALADVLEDRDWLGKRGRVIAFSGASAYRRVHPTDWSTLEDILGEAAEFWKERHVAFWVFTA